MQFIDDLLFLYRASRSRLIIVIFFYNKFLSLLGSSYRMNEFPVRRLVIQGSILCQYTRRIMRA
jgi:hypothetical protein